MNEQNYGQYPIRRFILGAFIIAAILGGVAFARGGAVVASDVQSTDNTSYRDPALWAPPNEPEGTQPGPVESLGYGSAEEAATQCSGQQKVITIYRQRQIVGYACGW
ncbi:MAG: hypothetical protein KDE47_21350 [Caldilineaceae bacterium]|nr:hypothetical protein [Caldilineaceae bacterium]